MVREPALDAILGLLARVLPGCLVPLACLSWPSGPFLRCLGVAAPASIPPGCRLLTQQHIANDGPVTEWL